MPIIPKAIVIHHSVSNRDSTTIKQLNEWHRQRWPNFVSSLGYWIGYSYVILGSGEVVQTREDTEERAHTLGGWNQKAIGICLTGSFNDWEVAEAQKNSLKDTLVRLMIKYSIPMDQIYYHGELWRTECPGKNLIKWIVEYRKPSILSLETQIEIVKKKIAELVALFRKLFG